ncbi:MAG: hypothetical protein E7255_10540 [Lachnospiraceae bacterium]|nr:hypothetical protein [Lachnospiraceae bacterium]
MEHLEEMVIKTKKDIEGVAEAFYQQRDQEGFENLVEVIDVVSKIVTSIEKINAGYEISKESLDLETSLKEATEAMVNKDTVLLADILKYDITDSLDNILNKIKGQM